MAITTAMCTSFKEDLLNGVHDLDADQLRVALIKESPTGTYDKGTQEYANLGSDEVATGGNYTRDSADNNLTIAGVTIATDATTGRAWVDLPNLTFNDVTVSADGCLIYNTSQSNKAICVIDFGGTVSATAGDLTIEFPDPTADGSAAIIRLDTPAE
jgi:hypothetical protein